MKTTSFTAFARRFFSNQQQDFNQITEERTTMAKWHHKLIRGVAALGLGLVIHGSGNVAYADSKKVLQGADVTALAAWPGFTTVNTNVDLCGWGWATTLRINTDQPHHDRVFALWNVVMLNGNSMNV